MSEYEVASAVRDLAKAVAKIADEFERYNDLKAIEIDRKKPEGPPSTVMDALMRQYHRCFKGGLYGVDDLEVAQG